MTDEIPGAFSPQPPQIWWIFILEGLIALLFGIVATIGIPVAVEMIVLFLGLLIIITSLLSIVRGFQGTGVTVLSPGDPRCDPVHYRCHGHYQRFCDEGKECTCAGLI